MKSVPHVSPLLSSLRWIRHVVGQPSMLKIAHRLELRTSAYNRNPSNPIWIPCPSRIVSDSTVCTCHVRHSCANAFLRCWPARHWASRRAASSQGAKDRFWRRHASCVILQPEGQHGTQFTWHDSCARLDAVSNVMQRAGSLCSRLTTGVLLALGLLRESDIGAFEADDGFALLR
jgi:hypothetical protein